MVQTVDKIEFKKAFKAYYSPKPSQPEILEIPDFLFVMADGKGDPNDNPDFMSAMEAIYGLVYTLKFSRKKAGLGPDFTVGPLEGLWWSSSGNPYEMGNKKDWLWTMMIMIPILITPEEFEEARFALRAKKPTNRHVPQLRLEAFEEGLVVQNMHIGPYANEKPSVDVMHDYAVMNGYEHANNGKHHEIYLNDPGRTAPSKLKTIVRHPIAK